MKRIALAVTAVALVAAAMAAWSGAVPLATSGADAPSQAKPKAKGGRGARGDAGSWKLWADRIVYP